MKGKLFFEIKKEWHIWMLAAVVLAALFLRGYKFNDWLVFKSDQARDVAYAGQVLEGGMGNLRLMGPKIEVVHIEGDANKRGDSLHLGPAYYYIQTAAAYLFGGAKPWTAALPDLILSILAIPLFYYFLRLNFSRGLSLLTTALFAFGFFLTQYGRFAWNPNQLIFWEMIFAIAIIKSYLSPDRNISGRWILAGAFAFGVASQLHTIALFSFPVIAGAFWIFYRPKSGLKYWALAALILLVLYLPVFVYEYKNNGDNVKRLVASMQRERDNSGAIKTISKNIQRHGEFAAVTLTTFHDREIAGIENAGSCFYLASFLLLLLVFLDSRVHIIEKLGMRKRINVPEPNPFLALVLIWTTVVFLLFTKIVDDLNRARYFLILSPVIYIFLALWLKIAYLFFNKKRAGVFAAIVFLTVFLTNLWAIAFLYVSLDNGRLAKEMMRNPKMNYYDDLVTLGDLKSGLDYMVVDSAKRSGNICLNAYDYQYKSVYNLLGELYYPQTKIENFKAEDLINDCQFYAAVRTARGTGDIDEAFWHNFEITDKKIFDFLTIYKMNYIKQVEEKIDKDGKTISEDEKQDGDGDPRITAWNEVFDKK